MNPRGRQYALGSTLTGWTRLTTLTGRQRRVLATCYAGINPKAFSRYGIRQWAAPWPGTRVVVKDPFAVLSVRAVHEATGAVPVLVYRHPAAVLASYRRMGWRADYDEVRALPDFVAQSGESPEGEPDDVWEMTQFWRFCNAMALRDIDETGVGLVVSHAEVAAGGSAALGALGEAIGLAMPGLPETERPPAASADGRPLDAARAGVLHDFQRDPAGVAQGWRRWVGADEVARMEKGGADVLSRLEEHRLVLGSENRGMTT